MNLFYPLFYGPSAENMGRIYQLMSEQGQFWKESWETRASNARTPIWGDWDRINHPPQPAEDQTLPLPPAPSPHVLALDYDWSSISSRRLQLAGRFLAANDELLDLLHRNLEQVEFNRYNLELYTAIAQLYRQNLNMILDLGRIETALQEAEAAAGKADPKNAVAALDRALDIAENIRQQRNQVFREAVDAWYKSWLPRVPEANGRKYLDRVDDVKDHLPVRTVDMTYLIYRELLYPLGGWGANVIGVRDDYAREHGLPVRGGRFDWKDLSAIVSSPRAGGQ
jgi:hypothetical protein